MNVLGLVWVGIRTDAFPETVEFFQNVFGLPVGNLRPQFVRLDLPDGGSVEVFYAASREYPHFSTGPVVGFQVADFDRARTELEEGGCELLLPSGGDRGDYRWQHFRAPDGNVYEIVDYPHRPSPGPPVGPFEVTRLVWTGVSTLSYEAMAKFLRATLGLAVEEETTELVECHLPDGSSIEVFRRSGPMDHPHLRTGPVPGFGIRKFEAALEAFAATGIPVLEARRSDGGAWAHFRAPDGRVYEVKSFAPEQEDSRANR